MNFFAIFGVLKGKRVKSKGAYLTRILTMLAGLIFLAHTVIPHHHHGQKICFGTDHCECRTLPNGDAHEDHDHPYDTPTQTHHCCVSEFIPASSLELPRIGKSDDSADKYIPDTYYSILPEQIFIKARTRKPVAYYQQNKHPLGVRIHSSSGLRAPPQI